MVVKSTILSVLNVGIVGGLRARRNMLVVLNVTQSLSDVDVVFCARAKFNKRKKERGCECVQAHACDSLFLCRQICVEPVINDAFNCVDQYVYASKQ